MKKILALVMTLFAVVTVNAQLKDSITIDAVSVVSFYRNSVDVGGVVKEKELLDSNYGQDPAHMFTKMPSIISLSDNGTDFGYGYFRIRGLDQTRINVTLDGCPWNEAEDFGSYFANSPDLMSSMQTIKVERGGSATNNGVAGSAGGINMESIDVFKPHKSYVNIGIGSYNTYKASVVYNMTPTEKNGLHIKATHQQTDGYRDNSYNKSEALTVKYSHKFNNNHSLDILSMNGYHRNIQGWIGVSMDELLVNKTANGCSTAENDNWFMSMNRLQYKGRVHSNIILTSSVYGQFQDGGYRFDLDNYLKRMVDPLSNETNIVYDYHLKHYMVGGNTFAKFYLRDFKITTGVNAYTYKRFHSMGDKGVNVPEGEFYNNYGVKNDFNWMTTVSYSPVDKFTVSANAQLRYVNFKYTDINTNDNFNLSWPFTNYGANVEYSPIKGLTVYAKYSHLNREPTRSDMFGGNEYYIGELVTTTPEVSDDFELGIDIFKNNTFSFNLNAYYMLFNNELVLNGEYGSNGLPCHENAKNSYRRGIEMSLDWNVTNKLWYTLNTSWSQNVVETETFGTTNHILSPAVTVFSEVSWKDEKWEAGLNYNIRSKMYVDMANEYVLPYSDSLNLWFKFKLDNCEFTTMINSIEPDKNMDFCTGMVGANGTMLYIQNSPFDVMCQFKYYF